uniref:Retrotransposon gag domain-containing protein n=1 Tax=Ananas comosus var. bracteatus TaxID=296719 RepID=A0A6V7PGU8_ANACO|nr:unnamed protein product [Ananas comosus var. bracteatus]
MYLYLSRQCSDSAATRAEHERSLAVLTASCGLIRLHLTERKQILGIGDVVHVDGSTVENIYTLEKDKTEMKEDFRKLRQGNRTVREYEREFTHLVNCVPGMVHTDRDRADYFERGLRPEIFRIISALKLKSFEEVLDRALWVERSNAIAREERELFDREREREKGKKRTTSGAGDSRALNGPLGIHDHSRDIRDPRDV